MSPEIIKDFDDIYPDLENDIPNVPEKVPLVSSNRCIQMKKSSFFKKKMNRKVAAFKPSSDSNKNALNQQTH